MPDPNINQVVVKFDKPEEFEGQSYDSIALELDGLTGRDMSQVKSQWAKAGHFSVMPIADVDFCIMVAQKASILPLEFFESLSAKSYMKVAQEVTNF